MVIKDSLHSIKVVLNEYHHLFFLMQKNEIHFHFYFHGNDLIHRNYKIEIMIDYYAH